jgi:hypothetical protein
VYYASRRARKELTSKGVNYKRAEELTTISAPAAAAFDESEWRVDGL